MANNTIMSDRGGNKTYKFTGFTSTILTSVAQVTDIEDNAWDETDMYTQDAGLANDALHHSAITTTIKTSISVGEGSITSGITLDAVTDFDTYIMVPNVTDIYRYSKFTTTLKDTISSAAASPEQLGWDLSASDDMLSSSAGTPDDFHRHSGFTTTILASISSPSSSAKGVGWHQDDTDLLTTDSTADDAHKHSGFTTTVKSSFASPSTIPQGITDLENEGGSVAGIRSMRQLVGAGQGTRA